ncbi:hypothetical protein CPB84DRAFT_1687963, partial [Gymnopilus junonius]
FKFLQTHYCMCATSSVEDPCQVLQYFGIYYRNDLQLLVCFEHCCGITLDIWVDHIQHYHHDVSERNISRRELEEMKVHISANYKVAATVDDLNLPDTLKTHLPMKTLYAGERPSVLLRYRCPVETSCRVWSVCSNKTKTTGKTHQLSQHIRKVHGKTIKGYQGLEPMKTQSLRIRSTYYHTFILPDDWKDPDMDQDFAPTGEAAALLPIRKSTASYFPEKGETFGDVTAPLPVTWPIDLGWTKYRNTTLRGIKSTHLRQLIMIPTKWSVKETKGCRNWLESGLLWVFGVCTEYLRNANLFLDEYHMDIRDEITSGSEYGKFRPLSPSKYRDYGRALGQTVAMTMRILHQMIQSASYQKEDLVIKSTNKQLSAAIILYQRIMQAKGSPTESLLHPLHSFFATLLQPGDLTADDFACPTDQTIFLLSIRPHGCYALPNTVVASCAAFRYCFYSILTHVVRIKFLALPEFKFFQSSSPSIDPEQNDTVDLDDESQEDTDGMDEHEEESEEKLHGSSEIDEEDLELMLDKIMERTYSCEDLSPSTAGDIHGASFSSCIKSDRYWVTTKDQYGRSTPFSRIHLTWAAVHNSAREQPGSTEFTSLADGHRWILHQPGNKSQEITLRKWSSSCNLAIRNFMDAVKGLLFNTKTLDDFRPQLMTDVKSMNAAPHRQIQNQDLLTPYRERLKKEIFSTLSTDNQKVDTIKAETWLKAEQAALTILAIILCLAGGISFRGWQLSSIRFDSSDSQRRNVWIIDKTCVVSHPKAKQRQVDYAPTLLAFPRSITTYLILYLYYIRPIACCILRALDRDDELHSTLLWVNPMPTKNSALPSPWDGQCISTRLQNFTAENMGIPLSPSRVRQISQAVMRDKFAQLFSATMEMEPILMEYGQICEFPPWHDLEPGRAVCLLAISQIWQAMLGLGPVMPVWLPIVDGSHIFPSESSDNWEMAFISAKNLVTEENVCLQDYRKLLETETMRRNLLTPIVAELMFGNSAARVDIDLPTFGLHNEVVAKAIQIIIFVASHSTLEFNASMLESEEMIGIYNTALEGVQNFRAEYANTIIWDSLGQEVYALHKVPRVVTAVTKEENLLLSIIDRVSEKRD